VVCWKEDVAKLNTISGRGLQYSAPISFCEFTTRDLVNHLNDRLFLKLLPKSPKTGQTRPNKKQGSRFWDGNRIRDGINTRVKDRVRRRTRDRTRKRTRKETGT
jgi:hypothetical protein